MSIILSISIFLLLIATIGCIEAKKKQYIDDAVRWRRSLVQLFEDNEVVAMSLRGCNPQAAQNCSDDRSFATFTTSPVIANDVDDSPTSDICTDIQPIGAIFTCEKYADLDLCGLIPPENCMKSCGACCKDILLPGIQDCEAIVSRNLCMDPNMVENNICNKTCNRCQGDMAVGSSRSSTVPIRSNNTVVASPSNSDLRGSNQEDAMLALKLALSNPPQSWEDDKSVCLWEGIRCKQMLVNEIIFWQFGLEGTLPPELSALTSVEWVDFGTNVFYGTLPKEYSTWNQLQVARFYDNQFTGELPVEFSNWINVQIIQFRDNQLIGTLSREFSTWTNVQDVILYGNRFSGTMPVEYSAWMDLTVGKFEHNRLTGSIPIEYSSWGEVELIYLGQSSFGGVCMPSSLTLSVPTNDFYNVPAC